MLPPFAVGGTSRSLSAISQLFRYPTPAYTSFPPPVSHPARFSSSPIETNRYDSSGRKASIAGPETKRNETGTYGKIGREPEPSQIRDQRPGRDLVDLAPDIGHVAGDGGQEDDVGGCFDGALELEKEGHPDEVEAELDGVEGCALLGGLEEREELVS